MASLSKSRKTYQFFCSGEVSPRFDIDILDYFCFFELNFGGVGHPELVTLKDLRRAALPATRPAAVAFTVSEFRGF